MTGIRWNEQQIFPRAIDSLLVSIEIQSISAKNTDETFM